MTTRRNKSCPCGSGERYKKCCGRTNGSFDVQISELAQSVSQGDFTEAIKCFKKDPSLETWDPQIVFDLGLFLKNRGQVKEAMACYQKLLSMKPDHYDANNNLGIIFAEQNKLKDAAVYFERTVALAPEAWRGLYNFGTVRRQLGQYEEALRYFQKTTLAKPDYAEAFFNIGIVLRDQEELGRAIDNFKHAISLKPDYPRACSELAIIYWVIGERDSCRQYHNSTSLDSPAVAPKDLKTITAFQKFVSKLLLYAEGHSDQYAGLAQLPVLYAIGDSHSLTLANRVTGLGRDKFVGRSLFVSGCKAWHLGNHEYNEYKYTFEKKTALIPSGATAVVMVGEIDCRIDEGILLYHKKNNNDLVESIRDVVRNYVAYVERVLRSKGIDPIICNIPAPFVDNHGETAKEEVVYVVKEFNSVLQEVASSMGIKILDIYSISRDKYGVANLSLYLDGCHLLPSAYDGPIAQLLEM